MLGTTVDEFVTFDANAESVFHIVINIMWKTKVYLICQLSYKRYARIFTYNLLADELSQDIDEIIASM
ncbi:hypothetical protein J2X77_004053 [Sphingobacterium sp. 2149]|nr:hypothetical protein [Sphingobacterium sp. 2149]